MTAWLLFFSFAFADDSAYSRGEYLVRAAGCRECHTSSPDRDFAGGLKLSTPFGDFYTPNISPDPETGIGKWTAGDLKRALRSGLSPSGEIYYPSFPYRSFSKLNDKDMDAIFAYLHNQRPIRQVNRPHDLSAPFDQRWLLNGWRFLFFKTLTRNNLKNLYVGRGPFVEILGRTDSWNRGAYLVEGVLHCTECHTPRGTFGELLWREWMSGSDLEFGGRKPPNITPAFKTGLIWTTEEWTDFLASGVDPQGRTPGSDMALVVRETSGLTPEDRAAVVEYLRSLKPIEREGK